MFLAPPTDTLLCGWTVIQHYDVTAASSHLAEILRRPLESADCGWLSVCPLRANVQTNNGRQTTNSEVCPPARHIQGGRIPRCGEAVGNEESTRYLRKGPVSTAAMSVTEMHAKNQTAAAFQWQILCVCVWSTGSVEDIQPTSGKCAAT